MLAGVFVSIGPGGHLVGYPVLGLISVGFFVLTVVLAHRLRAVAPHVAKTVLAAPAEVVPS
jgi:hypothetical protein